MVGRRLARLISPNYAGVRSEQVYQHIRSNGSLPVYLHLKMRRREQFRRQAVFKVLDQMIWPPEESKETRNDFLLRYARRDDSLEQSYLRYVNGRHSESDAMLERVLSSAPDPERLWAKRWQYFVERRWAPSDEDDRATPTIFQFWDKKVPEDVQTQINHWRDTFGAQNHRLYNEDEARELLKEHCGASALTAWEKCWTPAMKADLFRLVALHRFGGFYVDADMAPHPDAHDNLSRLSGQNVVYSRTNYPDQRLTNMFIGAKSGWNVLSETFERAFHNLNVDPDRDPLDITGPFLFTQVALEFDGPETKAIPNAMVHDSIAVGFNAAYKRTGQYWKRHLAERVAASG